MTIATKRKPFIGTSAETKRFLATLTTAWKAGITVYIEGKPGIGKTAIIESLGLIHDVPVWTMLGSEINPETVTGMPFIVDTELNDGRKTKVNIPVLEQWAMEVINNDNPRGGIIFIDEFPNATPMTRAALLRLLNERHIGPFKIPANIGIIIAGNPPDIATNGHDISAPVANRFLHLAFSQNHGDWLDGMRVGFNREIEAPERGWRGLVTSYLAQNAGATYQMPDDETDQNKAWPSNRSWDNVTKALGAMDSSIVNDEDTERAVRNHIIAGLIGDNAAMMFQSWYRNLRLPDYELVMGKPESIGWGGMEVDAMFAVLNNVLTLVDNENLEQSIKVMQVASKNSKRSDIIASLLPSYIGSARAIIQARGTGDRVGLELFGGLLKEYRADLERAGVIASKK